MTLLVKKLNLATVIAAAADLDLVARAKMSHHRKGTSPVNKEMIVLSRTRRTGMVIREGIISIVVIKQWACYICIILVTE